MIKILIQRVCRRFREWWWGKHRYVNVAICAECSEELNGKYNHCPKHMRYGHWICQKCSKKKNLMHLLGCNDYKLVWKG